MLTVRVAVCTAEMVAVVVVVVEMVAYAVTVEVAGAEGLVIRQLHAELIRGARTVVRKVGIPPV